MGRTGSAVGQSRGARQVTARDEEDARVAKVTGAGEKMAGSPRGRVTWGLVRGGVLSRYAERP